MVRLRTLDGSEAKVGDNSSLGESGGEEYEGGLESEGERERASALGVDVARLGEEEAAEPECGDGAQRLEPEQGLTSRQARGAESHEDGVTYAASEKGSLVAIDG